MIRADSCDNPGENEAATSRAVNFEEITRLYEGGSLTIDEVRAKYGHVIARYLLLAKYAVAGGAGWPRVDYPPKMFISHKWLDDNTACREATQLAEVIAATGVHVVFDQWWRDEEGRDLEYRIAQLASSRTVFFLLTPEYLAHSSLDVNTSRFQASWVEDEAQFVYNLVKRQRQETPKAGAIIDPTGLLLDPAGNPIRWFNRLFDVSTPKQWRSFLASFASLRVHTLSQADQQMIWKEARACAEVFISGRQTDGFSALARLAAAFPFVGDLAVGLVKMAREVGDLARACDAARLGSNSTEDWRWEHRWLEAEWKSLQEEVAMHD